jgi:hypothetical protein
METVGWQPRQTRWLASLSAALGWLSSLGTAPQAASGDSTLATHSCAIAVDDQASNPATAAKPNALTMTIPGCSVNLGSMTQDSSTYWKKSRVEVRAAGFDPDRVAETNAVVTIASAWTNAHRCNNRVRAITDLLGPDRRVRRPGAGGRRACGSLSGQRRRRMTTRACPIAGWCAAP